MSQNAIELPTVRNTMSSHFHQVAERSIGTRFRRDFKDSNFIAIELTNSLSMSAATPESLLSSMSNCNSSTLECRCRSATLCGPVGDGFFAMSSTLSARSSYLPTNPDRAILQFYMVTVHINLNSIRNITIDSNPC